MFVTDSGRQGAAEELKRKIFIDQDDQDVNKYVAWICFIVEEDLKGKKYSSIGRQTYEKLKFSNGKDVSATSSAEKEIT